MTHGAGPFRLKLAPEAREVWDDLKARDERKWRKVNKALKFLKNDPRHPGLNAHKWDTLNGRGPNGEDIWTAYVENHTPSAWRLFFFYDSRERGLIYVVSIEPHS